MGPLHPNAALPTALQTAALRLLVEAAIPLLSRLCEEGALLPGHGMRGADGTAELRQALRGKCDELSALVMRADDPEEAAAYVLGYLPEHFEFAMELLCGRNRPRTRGVFQAARQVPRPHGPGRVPVGSAGCPGPGGATAWAAGP
jgi:hypothetical protein